MPHLKTSTICCVDQTFNSNWFKLCISITNIVDPNKTLWESPSWDHDQEHFLTLMTVDSSSFMQSCFRYDFTRRGSKLPRDRQIPRCIANNSKLPCCEKRVRPAALVNFLLVGRSWVVSESHHATDSIHNIKESPWDMGILVRFWSSCFHRLRV
jgi:hypothetical protein